MPYCFVCDDTTCEPIMTAHFETNRHREARSPSIVPFTRHWHNGYKYHKIDEYL